MAQIECGLANAGNKQSTAPLEAAEAPAEGTGVLHKKVKAVAPQPRPTAVAATNDLAFFMSLQEGGPPPTELTQPKGVGF